MGNCLCKISKKEQLQDPSTQEPLEATSTSNLVHDCKQSCFVDLNFSSNKCEIYHPKIINEWTEEHNNTLNHITTIVYHLSKDLFHLLLEFVEQKKIYDLSVQYPWYIMQPLYNMPLCAHWVNDTIYIPSNSIRISIVGPVGVGKSLLRERYVFDCATNVEGKNSNFLVDNIDLQINMTERPGYALEYSFDDHFNSSFYRKFIRRVEASDIVLLLYANCTMNASIVCARRNFEKMKLFCQRHKNMLDQRTVMIVCNNFTMPSLKHAEVDYQVHMHQNNIETENDTDKKLNIVDMTVVPFDEGIDLADKINASLFQLNIEKDSKENVNTLFQYAIKQFWVQKVFNNSIT